MYRAKRPQLEHFNVTWARGGGGAAAGSLWIGPAHDGQLSDSPARSDAIRCRAWAGLYVLGRGFRISTPAGYDGDCHGPTVLTEMIEK